MKLTISILPLLFKVSKKSIFKQQSVHDKNFKHQMLCDFRKAHSTQQALFRLLKSWQKELDNSGWVCTTLMDLSKAYDCIPQDLLIAKLKGYRLYETVSSFLLDYVSRKGKRTKIGPVNKEWLKKLTGIPQGSLLGPLLFNISINDWSFFALKSEICSYVDNNMLHFCSQLLENTLCNFKYNLHNALKN